MSRRVSFKNIWNIFPTRSVWCCHHPWLFQRSRASVWWMASIAVRAEWKSSTSPSGERCVMMTGIWTTLRWSADRWDAGRLSQPNLWLTSATVPDPYYWITLTAGAVSKSCPTVSIWAGDSITVVITKTPELSVDVRNMTHITVSQNDHI